MVEGKNNPIMWHTICVIFGIEQLVSIIYNLSMGRLNLSLMLPLPFVYDGDTISWKDLNKNLYSVVLKNSGLVQPIFYHSESNTSSVLFMICVSDC